MEVCRGVISFTSKCGKRRFIIW